jgi:serine/threonine protein kinase/WD40 repeat protein
MMRDETCCQCGRPLSKGVAAGGLCPRCLLAEALDETAAGQTISELPAPETVPEKFVNYEIIGVLGEGGMGTVYLAVQQQPIRRRVAVKVVKKGMDSRQILGRFQAERQTLAVMDHPAIAKIYEAGTSPDGQPYFVMEYVQGIPITDYCDRNLLGYRERLELFREICRAVHHAHQKGVIHRDLKPTNILVGVIDGRPAPKIIDFGLAKVLTREIANETLFTELGVMLGTPEYMSPEQAEFGSLSLDVTTDIYAMGVILYELLVGVLPFDGKSLRRAGLEEIRRIIREEEPPRLSTRLHSLGASAVEIAKRRSTNVAGMARQLRGDLESITMKALDKDRTRRYASASEFAADLERHLNNEAVIAGAPSAAYRLRKLARKHRGKLVAASLLLFTLLAGLFTSSALYFRAERNRRIADWEAYKARLAAANVEIEGFRSEQAKELLFQCPVNLRGWEWKHLYAQSDSSIQTLKLPRGGSPIARIGFRGDSSRFWVAVANSVFEVDVPTAAVAATHGPFGQIITMTRDARLVVSRPFGAGENAVEVREVDSAKTVSRLEGHRGRITSAAFDHSGKRLATASVDGEIHVWNPENGKEVLAIRGPAVEMRNQYFQYDDTLAMSPDGDRIVFSLGSRMVLWDGKSGKKIADLPAHLSLNNSVVFTEDGHRILSGSDSVRIWDAANGQMIGAFTPYFKGGIRLAVPSPDSSTVLVVGTHREVLLYHWKSGLVFTTLSGLPLNLVTGAAFSPDARYMVFSAFGGEVKVWDAPSMGGSIAYKTWAAAQRRTTGLLLRMAVSADGSRIAEATLGGTLEVWESASGRVLLHQEHQPWEQGTGGSLSLASNSSGNLVAVGSKYGVQIWDVDAGLIRSEFRGLLQPVTTLAFRPDGLQLAAATDRSVRTWEIPSGRGQAQPSFSTQVRALSYSPDGRRIAVGLSGSSAAMREAAAQIIDSETGKVTAQLRLDGGPEPSAAAVAFSRDGARLAVMRAGLANDVWDTRNWRQVGALRTSVHSYPFSASFTPDGGQIISTDAGETLTIWDANRFEPILALHHQAGRDLFVHPDGATLYTNIGAVRVFGTRSAYSADADELVYRRLSKTPLMCDVRISIEEDQKLPPQLRAAALRALDQRQEVAESWLHLQEVLGKNDLPRSSYEAELKRAQAMARWFPSAPVGRFYVALALYRTGAYQQVLETSNVASAGAPPAYPAVLAMASHRLQQYQKARQFLTEAKRLMRNPPGPNDYYARVVGEAEKLVEGR